MHDFVLFMANTGFVPTNWNLQICDVKIEDDYATRTTILVIDVRGKVGTGYCKSMPNAEYPFQNLRKRREQELKELGKTEKDSEALAKGEGISRLQPRHVQQCACQEGLKFHRDGKRRTAHSREIEHTYRCNYGGADFTKLPITAAPACR